MTQLQLLIKTIEIARELVNILSVEYSAPVKRLLASMHDRVASNCVAMRTIKVLYPNIINIGCNSHTIDHVGEHFKAQTLEELIRITLFAHSPHTRFTWKKLTGRVMVTYSET